MTLLRCWLPKNESLLNVFHEFIVINRHSVKSPSSVNFFQYLWIVQKFVISLKLLKFWPSYKISISNGQTDLRNIYETKSGIWRINAHIFNIHLPRSSFLELFELQIKNFKNTEKITKINDFSKSILWNKSFSKS